MRYLSLFSGIEAATVAWEPLGWEAVAFCEWDDAPSAVLAHHYPNVPNFGDVSAITAEDIEAMGHIDLVVGGSPCQNLSLAGNRKGLAGDQSKLFHEQIRIFGLCKEIHGTRLLLWENVPGARTSNKGADFRSVVEEMAGLENISTPKYGWGTEGAAVGSKGLLEWATLDAQWFGLAQRRKRIFALLDTGDWSSRPPILLERESLRGDTPSRRETREDTATLVGDGVASELIGGIDGENNGFGPDDPCGPLMKGSPTGGGRPLPAVAFSAGNSAKAHGIGYSVEHTPPLRASSSGTNQVPTGVHMEEYGHTKFREADVAGSLRVGGDKPIVVEASHAFRMTAFGEYADDDTASTMKHRDYKDVTDIVVEPRMVVRRLTPVECCRLQGFPDDYLDVIHKGKPFSNSAKYKALGNSMAVDVMRYIGESIVQALRPE